MTLEALEAEVGRLRDTLEIYNLQARYNFLIGMNLGDRVPEEVFAKTVSDVSFEIGDVGRWEGIDSIRRVFGKLNKVPGKMGLIMAIQPLVQVAKDGKTARGQWMGFGPTALPEQTSPDAESTLTAFWMCGIYNMEYIKENGTWMIKNLLYSYAFVTPFDKGWVKQPMPSNYGSFLKQTGGEPDKPPSNFHPYGPDVSEYINIQLLEREK